ncbi:MAG: TIM-barrel domain-containing protein [Bacteroidota bacterium]
MKLFRILIVSLVLMPFKIHAQQQNVHHTISVIANKMQIIVKRDKKPILEVDSIQFDFITPSSMKVVQQSAEKTELALLYKNVWEAEKVNVSNDHTVDVTIENIDGGWHVYAHPRWAHNISIYSKSMGHYFGIRENLVPDNHKSPDITGSVQSFDVEGEGARYHENYASGWSAFFFNSLGYASFFDTFAKGEYQFAVNGVTQIYHRTGDLNWYIFTGANGDEIMKSYYRVIGAPKYVPTWATGVLIWRDQDWNGKEDILNDARQMTALKIPITSIMVDRPYSDGIDGWSKMNFGKLFSDPGTWIHELNADYNLRFMSWVAPCTFGDTSIVKAMPGGHHGYIDLTDPTSVAEFTNALTKNIYEYGVQGHKMDRGEEIFPVENGWHDRTPPSERRNKYISLYAKVIDSVLTAKWGKDNFNFSRSGMHGSQKYLGALWGGDSRESWDGLACNVANAMRCGFMGFPNWGSDVGGYRGDAGYEPEELYTRWLQFGTWSGMFQIKLDGTGGRGKDRAPWQYGKELQDNFRRACEERMGLAPYVFSQLNTSAENGVLMKPLAYAYPNDPGTYGIWDEYCFGQSFLVSPIVEPGQKSKRVYLPSGIWYDWYAPTNSYTGGKWYSITLSESHIPVFVRQNAIFVTGKNWLNGNSIVWNGKPAPELIINVFPGKNDFTNSFNYVDPFDNDSIKDISILQKANLMTVHIPALAHEGKLVIHNLVPKGMITVDGKKTTATMEKQRKTIEIPFLKMESHKICIKR